MSSDLVVQVILIAESMRLQAMMGTYGIQTQTPHEVEPVQIWPPSQLVKSWLSINIDIHFDAKPSLEDSILKSSGSEAFLYFKKLFFCLMMVTTLESDVPQVYEFLGINDKLGLKGRPSRPVGSLGTSKLYSICGQTVICFPLIFEVSDFYLSHDMALLIDDIKNELKFVGKYWRMSGRPTVCLLIREEHMRDVHFREMLDLLAMLKKGHCDGLKVRIGRLQHCKKKHKVTSQEKPTTTYMSQAHVSMRQADALLYNFLIKSSKCQSTVWSSNCSDGWQNLISSSCIEHLDFLHLLPEDLLPKFEPFQQLVHTSIGYQSLTDIPKALLYSEPEKDYSVRICTLGPVYHLWDWMTWYRTYLVRLPQYLCTLSQTQEFQNKPTWEVLEALRYVDTLKGQAQLLGILWFREGPHFWIDTCRSYGTCVGGKVRHCGCSAPWDCEGEAGETDPAGWRTPALPGCCRAVVRYCSSVLGKLVDSISPYITSALVNGKQPQLPVKALCPVHGGSGRPLGGGHRPPPDPEGGEGDDLPAVPAPRHLPGRAAAGDHALRGQAHLHPPPALPGGVENQSGVSSHILPVPAGVTSVCVSSWFIQAMTLHMEFVSPHPAVS
ncbi:PHKB [Cordylochernes scorpioides]|uniref:Phosphorylase b kinase regulatory subunit n=1 Tax=Cordylochernes scorpioides TaxID=51811 RepID=A0ABY6K024_9ARAC|nr:PHKB [Cordylochernes scorpioides]